MTHKKKISLILSIAILSLLLVTSQIGFASGKANDFSNLQKEIESIVDGNEENISVYISTKEGDIKIKEDKVYSSASTIKVPILIEALRQADQGILNLDEKVTVRSSDLVNGGGLIRHLSKDQVLSLRDLLVFMITLSDNTATNMMIERVGMESVNEACNDMGCKDTKLQRYMLESVKPKDNLTTAEDMGNIMREVYEGGILNDNEKKEFLRIMGEQKLTTNLPAYKDTDTHKGVKLYHKGGSLGSTAVKHDIGMFTFKDDVVYVAVLSKDISKKTAQKSMAEIGEHIMDYLVE